VLRVHATEHSAARFATPKDTEGRIDAAQRAAVGEKLARLHEWFLENTRREARGGAQLVAWPEANLLVFKEDEAAFLERARRLAAGEHIYLAMGMGAVRLGAPRPFENKIVLLDPSGKVAFSYLKSRPVPGWEAGIMVRGDGRLPVAQGRIGPAICFDADFPEFVRPIGRAQTDL
jgi:apolipoprotein N-acyltransferase